MKCINPKLQIKLGNRTIWRHWSLSNAIHRAIGIPFNCRQCIHCRQNSATELARRCTLHASLYLHNCFITLTYNSENNYTNELDYTHIQKFKKRLRKALEPKKVEIFNVHEYGSNGRKHWHLVIFNHDFLDKEIMKNGYYTSKALQALWTNPDNKIPYGHVTTGTVTEASAMYQAKYTQKDIENGNENNARKTKSNHSGIGKAYFLRHYKQILQLGYIPIRDNVRMPLPDYFIRLAHKHYCHFYDQSAFFDNKERKAIHRPFRQGALHQVNSRIPGYSTDDLKTNIYDPGKSPIKEIADLYITYKTAKEPFQLEQQEKWRETVNEYTRTKRSPDFIKSGENTLAEMRKKKQLTKETF